MQIRPFENNRIYDDRSWSLRRFMIGPFFEEGFHLVGVGALGVADVVAGGGDADHERHLGGEVLQAGVAVAAVEVVAGTGGDFRVGGEGAFDAPGTLGGGDGGACGGR